MIITILLILLGIALVVVFINRKKDEEKAKLAIMVITASAVVLAVMSLFFRGGGAIAYDPTADDSLARVAGIRIAEHAQGRQAVIIAETRNMSIFAQTRLTALQESLERNNVQILGISPAFPNQEIEEGIILATEAGFGPDALEAALASYPNAQLIISLAGLPSEEIVRLGNRLARLEFYAIDEQPMPGWIAFLEHRLLAGAVVSAIDADWADDSGTAEDLFNRRYVFVTRENLSDVRSRIEFQDTW
jgi:hypothetical protein